MTAPESLGTILVVDDEEVMRDVLQTLLTEAGYDVVLAEDVLHVELRGASQAASAVARKADAGPARVLAPMPGRLVRVLVQPGQQVQAGEGLLVMEAMKMENELRSPRSGRVAELPVREGQAVETAALLVVVE